MAEEACQHQHVLTEPPLVFEDVTFSYPGGAPVLTNVSMALTDQTHVCIIGPNGGGKTTLLRLALGLLRPLSGRVQVFGRPPHRACSHVGYVPQHKDLKRGFPITVREVVLTGCVEQHRLGWHHRDCGLSAEEVMVDMGIADLRNSSFDRLSGGQRQRVLIARALVGQPSLLLLDEPTANVDPGFEKELRGILSRLSERLTVVTVSHDLNYICSELDVVLFVNRSVRTMAPEEVTSDQVWRLFSRAS